MMQGRRYNDKQKLIKNDQLVGNMLIELVGKTAKVRILFFYGHDF